MDVRKRARQSLKKFIPMKNYFFILLLALVFTACSNSQNRNNAARAAKTEKIVRNQIKTEATGGLVVYQAFLVHEDGSLVGRNNVIKVGEDAELRLFVRGWVGPDGIISVGASQNFVSHRGTVLWEEPDLFAETGPVTVDQAQVIRVNIHVGIYQPEIKHYTTEIKVWNKVNPTQSATAKIKFKVEQ